ncbi:MAG: tRNA1(Val) (adenine(37)-N6)-methyltransferase [Proteobacteria bacterium]|nr:tRNA1(Val) (adenine(37)-N6)-methyltransferase [Pseudomonadota bacterium]
MDLLTTDTFFNGNISVKQNRNGYRFSIDAILLAGHVKTNSGDRILDIGTGSGIISLILASRNPQINIYGVEVQKNLADIAILNVKDNNLEDRIKILCADIKNLNADMISGPLDIVVSNPPYRKAESGRVNSDNQRAIARHEIDITLTDILKAASRLLHVSGRFIIIYPSERIADVVTQMRLSGIEPKNFRFIYSKSNSESKLVIVEGLKGGRTGAKIVSPLVIYNDDGTYTDEVNRMFMP